MAPQALRALPKLVPGAVVDGYRLVRRLGHGCEGTVWAVVERRTGLPFALKLLHECGAEGFSLARRTARTFHRLRGTAAVATYHRCGRLADAAFLLFDRLDGPALAPWLRRKRWRGFQAETMVLMLHALAVKLAAVHRQQVAIGDFAGGNNLVLVGGHDPVFCDLDVGAAGFPNRDYRGDLDTLAGIIAALAEVRPQHPTLATMLAIVTSELDRRPTRTRMTRVSTAFAELTL